MQVSLDAGAGGLAQIQAKIEALRVVELLQRLLGALRQVDQLMGGIGGQRGQAVQMRVGHHHQVAGGVGVGVEADKAVLSAQNEAAGGFGLVWTHAVGYGEVDGGDQVAEDAAQVAGPGGEARGNAGARSAFRCGDVGIAPGGPEMVHAGCAVQTV